MSVAADDPWAAATVLAHVHERIFSRLDDDVVGLLANAVVFRPSAAAFLVADTPDHVAARLTEKQRAMLVEAAALSAARW